MTTASIPSPASNGFHIGPLFLHAYGIAYVFAVSAAILISCVRWERRGGDREMVYVIITTYSQMPHHWWGPFAIWDGGLGIWGGIAGGAAAGIWRLRRRGVNVSEFMDVAAPGLLVAQAIGRIGNYFNQELFGKPTTLPWAVQISRPHRVAELAPKYWGDRTFQPTFLYELLFDVALACFLIWLGSRRGRIRAPGLFALYVAGYSGFRMFEETLRIDYSHHILGLRLNFFVALVLCVAGLVWFARIQWGWPGRRRVARAGGAAGLVWVVLAAAGCGLGGRVSSARAAGALAAPATAAYSQPVRQ
jgi:prolipoprotein diacylglyceryl transferase